MLRQHVGGQLIGSVLADTVQLKLISLERKILLLIRGILICESFHSNGFSVLIVSMLLFCIPVSNVDIIMSSVCGRAGVRVLSIPYDELSSTTQPAGHW